MALRDIVYNYRKENHLSQREFAEKCTKASGVFISHAYISMIESDMNPSTKKPPRPSVEKMEALAAGMGLTFQQLIEKITPQQPKPGVFIGSVEATPIHHTISMPVTPSDPARKWKMLSAGVLTLTDEQLDRLYDMAHLMYPDKFPERKEDD